MRSILITGGTGSFGRAFVKHALDNNVERICVYSRGEHTQAEMRSELNDPDGLRWFIGDVRDRDRLRRAFEGVDWVVHAAALKRIEVGHYNPNEMVKTNVLGAMNIIEAAMDAGVKKVLAISTDKACEPISAYGQTKALAESLFLAANETRGETGPIFAVVRYGNVAGSKGSIIPKWRECANRGGLAEITDPNCTRFWMTMDEAVNLVWDTLHNMKGGERVIPDLPSYQLHDLATAMDIGDRITVGLPPWEKKHESLQPGVSSDKAKRLTVEELKERLSAV